MHSTQCRIVLVISVMVLFPHSAVSQLSPEMIQGVVWPRQRIPVTDIQSHEVSSHCKRNLSDLPKAFDAFGKPAAGILVGNINWMGHFDECESLDGFQYCVVEFNISVAQSNPVMPFMLYGVCAPENCSESDVYNSMDFFVGEFSGNTFVCFFFQDPQYILIRLCSGEGGSVCVAWMSTFVPVLNMSVMHLKDLIWTCFLFCALIQIAVLEYSNKEPLSYIYTSGISGFNEKRNLCIHDGVCVCVFVYEGVCACV
ncbi:hypothetical protein HOLleu_09375 [Holothuria leucospilota]|uniref:Nose resistant-to-fluoxetine protein N-terminal domain-containing protein n=1 Tax=Holothuria leucospilota TaxID=206669 RepID=A0A9Q1CDL9_HOLLE|nr:hypothetical protein HOLleu_09375 [Holothuria leucospilota]